MGEPRKPISLVKKGYKEAHFRSKSNADEFARLWQEKGYRTERIRSGGPVVEGGSEPKAYGVMVAAKRQPTVRKARPRPYDPFGAFTL